MLVERTTLASVVAMFAEALRADYGIAFEPLFRQAGLDPSRLDVPGARYDYEPLQEFWRLAREATADPALGLRVGSRMRPGSFHALGFAWFASDTLADALGRLTRYMAVISYAPIDVAFDGRALIVHAVPDVTPRTCSETIECFLTAVLGLCRLSVGQELVLERVELERPSGDYREEFQRHFGVPVTFSAPRSALHFDSACVARALSGGNAELARSCDEIVRRYLTSLDPARVSDDVRELLVQLLPAGGASQAEVARRTHRSVSTLQRLLQREGTSFRTLREQTCQALAERYLRETDHRLSEIAFLLGFADQSNFSRAFKRWTNLSPLAYRRLHNERHTETAH